MTTFDERQRSAEARYAREQEFAFKTQTRAAKRLGLWAAEKLGISGDEAEAYAREVVRADFAEAGIEDVVRKVKADFDAKGIDITDHTIRRCLQEYTADAEVELAKEVGR
jgi:hypothetical protein